MKRTIVTVLITLLVVVGGVILYDMFYDGESPYIVKKIESKILSETRELVVRLPDYYLEDRDKTYTVIYKLDGQNRLWRYDHTLDVLRSVNMISDMIVVTIPNKRNMRNRDLTPSHMFKNKSMEGPKGGGDRFLDFIEKELIPYIEATYRTNGQRIFAGHSRGGLLVMHSLITRPYLFSAHIAFSPAFWRDDLKIIEDAQAYFSQPTNIKGYIYMSLGDQENSKMTGAYKKMESLLKSIDQPQLKWTMDYARGGTHQTTPIIALPYALVSVLKN